MAVVAVAALVATACGSSKKKTGTAGSAGSSGSGAAATPVAGGNLVIGIDAEEPGLLEPFNTWDNDGLTYGHLFYDTITALGDDGKYHPFLAQSVDHSADYKQWTIKIRPNIKFSNGDPLTAQSIVDVINGYRKGPITAAIYLNVADVAKVDDQTVQVTMQLPWVPFDSYLAGIFVFNPTMLADPKTSDHHPVGTGPYTLKEWIPGNHMTVVKNPGYWQQGQPYLDSIELRPIVDRTARASTLQAGTIQAAIMDDPETVANIRKFPNINEFSESKSPSRQEINFIMLNTGAEPFNDANARLALARATDKQAIIDTVYAGNTVPANQIFNKSFPLNTGDSAGYPAFDVNAAKDAVKAYSDSHGGKPLAFELGTVNDPKTLQAMQLVQSQWQKAGMQITLKQVEQSQYISNALVGKYQAYEWRQFGEPDPDGDFIWWHSALASPEGQLALNFARNKDPLIDANLVKGRTSADPAVRKAAYQDIARQINKDLPFIWIADISWSTFYKPNINGVVDWTLPDGSKGVSYTSGGVEWLSHWFISK
ncbi:MAG: peptide/nickel transport system substrate-binding protein [Acidimicrobiaceae bacterium]|nr:peptide/nickel transport system substrate-binding protein [Acidimicrobiaceae bacterium]